MRFIIATNNKHKLKEFREIFGEKYDGKIFSIADIGVQSNPTENGKDFKENSLIKASALYKEITDKKLLKKDDYIIADDTGLCIEYLNGAPGLFSARYLGDDIPQHVKNEKIIDMMKDVSHDKRNAFFITILTVIHDGNTKQYEGKINGHIALFIDVDAGFGYDPIFEVNGKTFAEMGPERKNKISHRAIAVEKFLKDNSL